MICEYCGHEDAAAVGLRGDVAACIDTKACDKREEAQHQQRLRELRRLNRDELSEAERQELADAR